MTEHIHKFEEREGSLSEWCACGAVRWKGETDEETAAMEGLFGAQGPVSAEYHNVVSPPNWSTKTPAEILADVNAQLEALDVGPHEPLTMNYKTGKLAKAFPSVPGSYWDFDKLIVPWEPYGRLLMREQITRYMGLYRRVRRVRRPHWAVRA